VLPFRLDVSKAAEVEALGAATFAKFGAPHFVFNNAGVGTNGLAWEQTARDWEWVFGVNVMGVAHGIRVFTPMMLEAAKKDASYEGHIVNTASMAGMLSPPNGAVYNASKHAVVTISETLYNDLALVTDQITASVLCPFFVPTGIIASQRNRPGELQDENRKPTKSQLNRQRDDRKGRDERQDQRGDGRAVRVRCAGREALLHLQPPEGARERADPARRHHARPQPDRPVRRQARDRREAARRAARRMSAG